tara:strand:- start:79 stop:543 length:465 start_codon:yes stop_codon:yes gene_type:complete
MENKTINENEYINSFNLRYNEYLEKKYNSDKSQSVSSESSYKVSAFVIAPIISMFGTFALFFEGIINLLIYLIKSNEAITDFSRKVLFFSIDFHELLFSWKNNFSNILGEDEKKMIQNGFLDLRSKIEKSITNLLTVVLKVNENQINEKFSEIS